MLMFSLKNAQKMFSLFLLGWTSQLRGLRIKGDEAALDAQVSVTILIPTFHPRISTLFFHLLIPETQK